MLNLKTKKELAGEAFNLASSYGMVHHRSITYAPMDFETRLADPPPEPENTVWAPLTRDDIRQEAALRYSTMFGTDAELRSFEFMVAQSAIPNHAGSEDLLIRTAEGLRRLTPGGVLELPTGEFVPNTVHPILGEDPAHIARVFDVIVDWLGSEEEAHSLLHHVATALAPGWSAVKYVLLLGEGRNGKSLLLKMLITLLGRENISNVTRQHISDQSPVVTELNGKLLNIVFDGQATYLKDSGTEKTLIAGEIAAIRKLYESSPTLVQTNALFIEGLQREPKSNDKSSALQKRLVRFQFPNVYPLDLTFEKQMLSEESVGALLALLIQHYVKPDEVATKLKPTQRAVELQLDHMYVNSMALQFLKTCEEKDPLGSAGLIGIPLSELAKRFQSWRLQENDLQPWSEPDILAQFAPLINADRVSVRTPEGPRKVRAITSLKAEAEDFLALMKGDDKDDEDPDAELAAMVAD